MMKNKFRKTFLIISLCLAMISEAQTPEWMKQSKVVNDTIYSKVLNVPREFNVFLPKSYEFEKDRKYPVLYLLHGMNDTNQSWYGCGHVKDVMDRLVASGEADEMIIVTPNAGGNILEGYWNGYFDMPGWDYEKFFFTEFMPMVETKYRVSGERCKRAVAGLSMGGGGATSYAQRHTDKFVACYAMSALMSIPEYGAAQSNKPDDKLAILTKAVIDKSCINYITESDQNRKEDLRKVSWFVDCGDDDFLLDRNIEFFQAMRNSGIPCQFRVRDGGHDWEYWHSALYSCLPFVSRSFCK